MPADRDAARYEAMARHFEALASPTRIGLLHLLRTPRELHEIRAPPSLRREGEREDRSISRQAVTRHLRSLEEAGLVRRTGEEAPWRATTRGESYILDHERLFALIDEMRALCRLQPEAAAARPGETVERTGAEGPRLCPAPRLVVAYGRDDGASFPLRDEEGAVARVGRSSRCEVRLDYDPYLSGEHCRVERAPDGAFWVEDLGSRNGTRLDWRALQPRERAPLRPGAVLIVGRSVLVFQRS